MRGGDVCARAWPHHWLSEQVTDCWTEKKNDDLPLSWRTGAPAPLTTCSPSESGLCLCVCRSVGGGWSQNPEWTENQKGLFQVWKGWGCDCCGRGFEYCLTGLQDHHHHHHHFHPFKIRGFDLFFLKPLTWTVEERNCLVCLTNKQTNKPRPHKQQKRYVVLHRFFFVCCCFVFCFFSCVSETNVVRTGFSDQPGCHEWLFFISKIL